MSPLPTSSVSEGKSGISKKSVIAAVTGLALLGFAAVATTSGHVGAQRTLAARTLQEEADFKPSTDFFTRQSFRGQFADSKAFTADFNALTPAVGLGGEAKTASVTSVPALWGEGVALVTIDLLPCGQNAPHVHPRATEFTYVIEGEKVQMAFVEENGGRLISNDLTKGQAAFFPKGLAHYQFNDSCKPAKLIAALNSEDFGTQTITTQALKNLPTAGLAAAMGISEEQLATLREGFPGNPVLSEQCNKRCGFA